MTLIVAAEYYTFTIHRQAAGKNVVVIGASFIGMEVASSLVEAAESVTVCEYFSAPYQTVLGSEVRTWACN